MVLTESQKIVVENNMGLVGKVMRDKLHGGSALSYYTHDDLFQIGCIGLCKAAATDKGIACFSTYAYRLIWNEICDALVFATRRVAYEVELDASFLNAAPARQSIPAPESLDLKTILRRALENAPEGMRKGLAAALLMAEGYTSREAGMKLHMSANSVRALASRARRYLRESPEFSELTGGCL